jgi:arsenite transporter
MRVMERLQPILMLVAAGAGLLLGQVAFFEQYAGSFILPFLLIMLYGLFLTIPLRGIKRAFTKVNFLSTSVILNFLWTPLLAWGLGAVFLADHPAIWLGFILLLVTPCTDWYLIFTSTAKGNMPLSTSILPVNLLLQVTLLPVYLFIFSGTMETFELTTLIEVVLFLFLPFAAANLTRFLLREKEKILKNTLIPFFGSSQIFFLCAAIAAMFASQGSHLLNNLEVILLMIVPLLLFFAINFLLAQTAGRIFKFSYEDTASLNMTITARNSPLALAVVLAAFPEQPLIALALIIGPLIELPVLAAVAQILLHLRNE